MRPKHGHLGAIIRKTELEGQARELRAKGFPYTQIAAQLGIGERTVRRWLKDRPIETVEVPAWPEVRIWPPEWTLDMLTDILGFDRSAWKGNLEVVEHAQAKGNRYLPWFFRRLVEIERAGIVPPGKLDWGLALAALPILGELVGDTGAAEALEGLIRQHRPWEKTNPPAYRRAARAPAERFKESLLTVHAAWRGAGLVTEGTVGTGSVLLAALASRVPDFDKPSLIHRPIRMGTVVLQLLAQAREVQLHARTN